MSEKTKFEIELLILFLSLPVSWCGGLILSFIFNFSNLGFSLSSFFIMFIYGIIFVSKTNN